jgi:hypothetical protein
VTGVHTWVKPLGMITGLIRLPAPERPGAIEALADTLSALVGGVAAGVVGDAVIVASAETADIARVVDATGATFVRAGADAAPWAEGARHARREWCLCLEAGDVPADGWIRSADRFAGLAGPEVALARLRRPHAPLLHRLLARIDAVAGTRHVRAGDLVRRAALVAQPARAGRLAVRPLAVTIGRA